MSGNQPFGFGLPDDHDPGSGFDMGQLGAMLQQLGAMLQSGGAAGATGPVNWPTTVQVARQAAVAEGGDPPVDDSDRESVRSAVEIAETWLDPACTFPRSGADALAWNRSQWLEETLPAWQTIITPIAEHVQSVVGSQGSSVGDQLPAQIADMFPGEVPPEAAAMLAPLLGMAQQLGATMFGLQVGQALGALSTEVLGAADIGVPLTERYTPTLLPRNVRAFASGLDIPHDQVLLYLALREAAHQRLFAHVPWLRARIIGAVDAYARGIHVDTDRLREAMGDIDPQSLADPGRLQEMLGADLFQPEDTEEQRAALARLETLLALVEGWVTDVVAEAAGERLPAVDRLAESMRRRRAAGGPAERTMASLVGLDLRPRALREAARLWALLRTTGGAEARDALWGHPDLLPDHEDLDDPEGFVARQGAMDTDAIDMAEFDDDGEPEQDTP